MPEEQKKLFKVIKKGHSCNGGNHVWKVGEWMHYDGKLRMCESGFHLTTDPYRWFVWGADVYEAEAKNIAAWYGDKCVCSDVLLVKKSPKPAWLKDTEKFVKSIKKIKFFKPDGKPDPNWKLFLADSWGAARDAAWDAARDAAWDAAWDAARGAARGAAWDAARDAAWDAARGAARDAAWDAARDAAWDAARGAARDAAWDAARDAAWDAARGAARDAAWDAAWDAARGAARDAAWDVSLMAAVLVCADLSTLEKKHTHHAETRMEVWKKGYGLLCDVNGVLYVYGVKSKKQEKS